MSTTLERLDKLEQNLKGLLDRIGSDAGQAMTSAATVAEQKAELAATRVLALEQAMAALTKTLAAVTWGLHNQKILDQSIIIGRIRDTDDQGDREKVQSMLKDGLISKAAAVGPIGITVVSQNLLDTTDPIKSKMIRSYSIIESPSPFVNPQLIKDLQGRKVGDTLPAGRGKDGVYTMTIIEIYDYVLPKEVEKKGEDQASPEPAAPAAAT